MIETGQSKIKDGFDLLIDSISSIPDQTRFNILLTNENI